MIKTPTVLVLGAGASMDYGFPSGEVLLRQIHDSCINPTMSDNFLRALACVSEPTDRALELGSLIESSPIRSIDALLEHHQDFVKVGKAAIAAMLLPCEKPQVVRDVNKRSESWYQYLWECIQELKFADLRKTGLVILTYNYDRSLDFFLRQSMQWLYKATPDVVEGMMAVLPIIHLHGQLGDLATIPYGQIISQMDSRQLKSAVEGIKIIHEQDQNAQAFAQAKRHLKAAKQIIFLGFGFHVTNIGRLIDSDIFHVTKYATAFGCTAKEMKLHSKHLNGCDCKNLKILEFLRETCLLRG